MSRPDSATPSEAKISNAPTRRFVLAAAVLSATNFLSVFDGLVVTVALPRIQHDLGLSQLSGQWIITSYSLPLGGLLLLGGRCGDRYGRRRVMIIGLWLFIIGLLVAGLAQSAWTMFPARAMQGTGAALAIPNTYAMISSMRSAGRRNRVFAAVAVAGSSGAAGGAIIGGLVTQTLGWRYVFILSAPIALLAVLSAPKVLGKGADHEKPPRIDVVAAVLSTSGLMLLVYSITSIEQAGLSAPQTLGTFAGSVLLLYALVRYEQQTWAPLLRPRLLRIRTLRASILGMPGQVFAYTGTVYVGLLFFQDGFGYSPLTAGLAFAPLGVASFIISPLATRLLREVHWSRLAFGAQSLCATGLVLFALAEPGDNYVTAVLPGLLLLGCGIAIAAVTLNLAAGNDVAAKEKGVAYGLFETSTHVSGALVIAVLATVATAGARHFTGATDAETLSHGYRLALATAAGFAFTAGIMTAVVGRPSRTSGPGPETGAQEIQQQGSAQA